MLLAIPRPAVAQAKRHDVEVDLRSCVDADFAKRHYGWLTFTNHCDVTLKLTWIFAKPGFGGGAMTLKPGRDDTTADSKQWVDEHGPYELSVCLEGFHPAAPDESYWSKFADPHHCRADGAGPPRKLDAANLLALSAAERDEKIVAQLDGSTQPSAADVQSIRQFRVTYKQGRNGVKPPINVIAMKGKPARTTEEILAIEEYLVSRAIVGLRRDLTVTELYRDPSPKETRHQLGAIDVRTSGSVESMLREAMNVSFAAGRDVLVILEIPVSRARQLSIYFMGGVFSRSANERKRTGGAHLHIQPQDAFEIPTR